MTLEQLLIKIKEYGTRQQIYGRGSAMKQYNQVYLDKLNNQINDELLPSITTELIRLYAIEDRLKSKIEALKAQLPHTNLNFIQNDIDLLEGILNGKSNNAS